MTYSVLARTNEARLDRELDEHLAERDLEDMEYRSCPLGPGPECVTCRLRLECEE